MKDCDGNNLKIGDRVAVQKIGYRQLKIETVVGFSNQTVRITRNGESTPWRNIEPFRLAKVFNQ